MMFIKKVKDLFRKRDGVSMIEFSFALILLCMLLGAGVDVYSLYNTQTKVNDAVDTISLGISRSNFDSQALNDLDGTIKTFFSPITLNDADYSLQVSVLKGSVEINKNVGSLSNDVPPLKKCTLAEAGASGALNDNNWGDVVSTQLCVRPNAIQKGIFTGLLQRWGGQFSRDITICHSTCVNGYSSTPQDGAAVQGSEMGEFYPNTLYAYNIYLKEWENVACRMVVRDVGRYGPCFNGGSLFPCTGTQSAFYFGINGGPNILTTDPAYPPTGYCNGDSAYIGTVVPPGFKSPLYDDAIIEIYNACNNNNADNIGYTGPDDTRTTAITIPMNFKQYVSSCANSTTVYIDPLTGIEYAADPGTPVTVPTTKCTDPRCDVSTITWQPKDGCAPYRVAENPQLKDNGLYYRDDICPHPDNLEGNSDGCTRVLEPPTGKDSITNCTGLAQFNANRASPAEGLLNGEDEWIRIQRFLNNTLIDRATNPVIMYPSIKKTKH